MEYKEKRPLDYAIMGMDTMMRKFSGEELPPKGRFHYHQGVFLSGVYQNYLLKKEEDPTAEKYYEFMKTWVDSCIDEKGELHGFNPGEMDDIQPGILLYPLYDRTGDERYKKVLDQLAEEMMNYPRLASGGYYHKAHLTAQMWLDGLYMGGPFSVEYGLRFGNEKLWRCQVEQVKLMRQNTRDEKTGLWYHAYDESRAESWADPETGRSPEFWGRSIGWVPVAILNELDLIPKEDSAYQELSDIVKDLLLAICRYQSESGLWYQVVDKVGAEGNWPETSCSCLYVAAVAKAVRLGILPEEYREVAERGYRGVIDFLGWDGENLLVENVCIGTGVGDYKHYCERPVSTNDLHGMGAFLIMCAQMQQVL